MKRTRASDMRFCCGGAGLSFGDWTRRLGPGWGGRGGGVEKVRGVGGRRRRRRRRRKRDEATVARHTVEVSTIFCLTL
jgi:hypothetical protein